MEFYIVKANLVLSISKPDAKGGDPKTTNVTLSNVRKNLTAEEIQDLRTTFTSLIKHEVHDIYLVHYLGPTKAS